MPDDTSKRDEAMARYLAAEDAEAKPVKRADPKTKTAKPKPPVRQPVAPPRDRTLTPADHRDLVETISRGIVRGWIIVTILTFALLLLLAALGAPLGRLIIS